MSSADVQETLPLQLVNMNESKRPKADHCYREFLCGSGAAVINVVITFPLNKLIFRQQLLGVTTREAIIQLKSEGLLTLYRGVLPPLLQRSASVSIMFGMYEKFNEYFQSSSLEYPLIVTQATSAILTGCAEAVVMPFERVQTLLQNKTYQKRYKNTFHAFRELQTHGFREYYRGLTPVLLRNGPSNFLFFQFRERIKKVLPQSNRRSIEVLNDFISGGVLGAIISTIFFPLNVVKAHMQSSVGGEFPGFWKSFKYIFAERNCSMRNLFRGVHVNYSRSMLSWGLINTSYEFLKKIV